MASLLKSSVRTFGTTLLITGITLATSVITARQLGPEGRGLLAAFLLVANLSAAGAQLGLANSFIFHRRGRPNEHFEGLALYGVGCIAVLAPLLALAIVMAYGKPDVGTEVALFTGLSLGSALLTYFNTLCQLEPGLGRYNLGRALVPGLIFCFAIITMAGSMPVSARDYVLVQALATALVVGLMVPQFRRQVLGARLPDRPMLTRFVSYAAKLHGNALIGLVIMNMDKVFMMHRASAKEFGIYAVAYSTTRMLGFVQDSASTALYAKHAGKGDVELSAAVKRVFRLTFVPMLCVAALVAVGASWLITLVFGARFETMILPFSILCFEAVVGAASWTLNQRLAGGGRPGLMMGRNLLILLVFGAAFLFWPGLTDPVQMAVLMLILAFFRLTISLAVFPKILQEAMPTPWPKVSDAVGLVSRLRRK